MIYNKFTQLKETYSMVLKLGSLKAEDLRP